MTASGPIPGHHRIDRFEFDDRLIIKTHLPGVERDDIDLRLEGRDLVIYGARHDEDEVKDDDRPRMEPGSILRRIPMPFCVTADDIQANFGDSVLRVEVRKTAGTHPKGEKINASIDDQGIDVLNDVEWIERQLKTRLADAMRRLSVLKQRSRVTELDDAGDNTPLSEGVEASWAMAERDSDRAESARLMADALELQSALKRIETGGYGRCLDCGGRIAPERLRVLPEASRCVTCETRKEGASAGSST